ncbi:MAG: Bug family tripartite tricarboxylate transporter substrate binding protein [Burkholderiales bacterium]
MRRAPLFALAAAALCGDAALAASADAGYPTRPIRLVVPFAPGGTPDIQARLLAEPLRDRLGKAVVVDNRVGANGIIGMEIAARAPADGYTLIIGTVGNWAVHPHLSKLAYDVVRDFAPVIHVATSPGVLVVNPSIGVNSVKDLVAMAKQHPGKLNYGSAGIGGFGHVCAALFEVMTQTRMTHVPYKSTVTAMTEIVTGQIQVLFNSTVQTMPHIKSGRLRGLATTGASRAAVLPDLPTIAEAGVPGYENSTWSAIAAPAGTPQPIVRRLNSEFARILKLPEIQERYAASGSTITGGPPEEMRAILKTELAKYGKLVKEAGITTEAKP